MMLATETRVQVSILGYLSSDLKEAPRLRGCEAALSSPHPTPHTLHPTPYFPEKAYSAIQAKKNETFALRISPDW
jgi:hypothetical protein